MNIVIHSKAFINLKLYHLHDKHKDSNHEIHENTRKKTKDSDSFFFFFRVFSCISWLKMFFYASCFVALYQFTKINSHKIQTQPLTNCNRLHHRRRNTRKTPYASTPPANCAAIYASPSNGRMPGCIAVSIRAIVTWGLANMVDDVAST